jgi:bile acid:Na+ symporter, BASS family
MENFLLDALKLVAPLSVACIVFAQGLATAPSLVLDVFKWRLGLVPRILIAGLVLVPAAALAILLGLHADKALAVGLAILVACPPAPLMFSNAAKKGASTAFMARLHLGFSALAFLTVPAVLYVLSGALGFKAETNLRTMGWILARTNLMPIILGLTIRGLAPTVADRIAPIVGKAGTMGIVIVVLVALAKFYPALLRMDAWSYLVIALVSVAALAIGHFAGSDDPHERTALAIECGVRHPTLAITIAAANFGSEWAMPVLVPCVVTFIAIATVYLSWRGRAIATAEMTVV